jgi:hypothetical protein
MIQTKLYAAAKVKGKVGNTFRLEGIKSIRGGEEEAIMRKEIS